MASSIVISVVSDVRKAVGGLDTVEGKLGKVGRTAGVVGKAVAVGLGAGLVAAGAGAIKLAQGAAEDEKAAKRLETVLRNATGATTRQVSATESWITAQGKAFGVADDDLRPALGRLAAATKDIDKSQRLASLAMDVSAGSGKSLEAVSTALAKAQTGNVGGLSRLGVATKDAEGKTRSLKDITADLAKTYKGSADTAANTTAGRFGRLKLQLDELGETIGGKLLPIGNEFAGWMLDKAIPALSDFGGYAGRFGPVLAQVGDVFSRVGDVVGQFAADALPRVLPLFSTLGETITGTILPAVLAVAGYLSGKLFPIFAQVAGIISGQVIPVIVALGQFLYGTLIPAVVGIATKIAGSLKPILDQLFATIQTKVLPAVSQILTRFNEWRPTLQKVVMVVVKVVGWVLRLAAAILGKVLPPLIKLAGWILGKLIPALLNIVGAVIKVIGWLFTFGAKIAAAGGKVADFARKVGDKIGDVLDWFRDLPGKVLSAVGDLGKTLYNAGRDIIAGLIDGIEDKVGDLRDKLGSITKLIPDVKGPPAKDARLLTPAGQLIMDGLIAGLEDRRGALVDTLTAITRDVTGTVTGTLDPVLLAGGTRATFTPEALAYAAGARSSAVHLTADELSQLERGRRVTKDAAHYAGKVRR